MIKELDPSQYNPSVYSDLETIRGLIMNDKANYFTSIAATIFLKSLDLNYDSLITEASKKSVKLEAYIAEQLFEQQFANDVIFLLAE